MGVARCSGRSYTTAMSRAIAQRDLRNQNSRIIAAVEAGASFAATRNGTPVAELRPLARSRRPFVPRAKIASVAAAGPRIDAKAFPRDLDAALHEGIAGWVRAWSTPPSSSIGRKVEGG